MVNKLVHSGLAFHTRTHVAGKHHTENHTSYSYKIKFKKIQKSKSNVTVKPFSQTEEAKGAFLKNIEKKKSHIR